MAGSGTIDFVFYYYTPSAAAAGIFLVLFGLTSLLHFYQLVRTRTWFMIPFVIGGIRKWDNIFVDKLLLTFDFTS